MNKVIDKRIIYFHENYDQNMKIYCQFIAYIFSMLCLHLDLRHKILRMGVFVIFIIIFFMMLLLIKFFNKSNIKLPRYHNPQIHRRV